MLCIREPGERDLEVQQFVELCMYSIMHKISDYEQASWRQSAQPLDDQRNVLLALRALGEKDSGISVMIFR